MASLLVCGWLASEGVNPASAKGISYIRGVTISGGALTSAREIAVRFDDNYDEMYELEDPGLTPADLSYDIVIHYDFSVDGYGARDWPGKFDGRNVLYFPNDMIVGNGSWAAGWYTVGDLLAGPMQQAVSGSGLPAAGSQQPPTGNAPWAVSVVVGLALFGIAALTLGAMSRSRLWFADLV